MLKLRRNVFMDKRAIGNNESKPYLISVFNPSGVNRTVNLFDANTNSNLPNFGNATASAIATNTVVLTELSVINIIGGAPASGELISFASGITGKFFDVGFTVVGIAATFSLYDMTGLPAATDTFTCAVSAWTGTSNGVNLTVSNGTVLTGLTVPTDKISVVGNPTLAPAQTINFMQVGGTYSNDTFLANIGAGSYYGFLLVNSAAPALIVTVPIITSSYARLLSQSQNEPFYFETFIVYTSSQSQANQTMLVTYYDSNGRQCADPIPPIYQDPYQAIAGIEIYHFPIKIDGNTGLQFVVLPNQTVTLVLFPDKIANMSNLFYGKEVIQKYVLPSVPSLNGGNKIKIIAR